MKKNPVPLVAGILIFVSCLITAPVFWSSLLINYQHDGAFGGLLAAMTAVGWLSALVVSVLLIANVRYAWLALILAFVLAVVSGGGPAYIPFIGFLLPNHPLAIFLVNLLVVAAVVGEQITRKKAAT